MPTTGRVCLSRTIWARANACTSMKLLTIWLCRALGEAGTQPMSHEGSGTSRRYNHQGAIECFAQSGSLPSNLTDFGRNGRVEQTHPFTTNGVLLHNRVFRKV